MKTRIAIYFSYLLLAAALLLTPTMSLAADSSSAQYTPDITFTLRTAVADGRLVYIGQGGAIDGEINPTLRVPQGAMVQINMINGDGALHDVVAPDFNDARSDRVSGQGSSSVLAFRANQEGEFAYWCSVPGHRAAGMEGMLVVGEGQEALTSNAEDMTLSPMDLPDPIGDRGPRHHEYTLETIEKVGQLDDGTSYKFWTFDGTVPGPFLRVREGDTVTVNLENPQSSTMIHSVDFHAVTGPGGGAAVTQASPGTTESFTFKALQPGLYVYHCATPMVAHHITNGMYGLILVEPEGGLAEVDREFYVMQGELYTAEEFGTTGELSFSIDKLLDEDFEYMVFNGSVNALKTTHQMTAQVGETVRIFFGVGGPNATSSFHVIGEIFDRVYDEGALTDPPLHNIQTTSVAPGGASMVEFEVDYPGRYILVDHALSRMERGLAGFLTVEGEADEEVFDAHGKELSGH
ncbi:copper-containing nitrite reductase [Marinospirillum perlucidum]|uniref:copper-containing nitrite reductase n=1 Tax=Marinospirillum perlucidum TaxID=1982602 RepID=UPI001C499124|nr:copper-containing nitrite reductase [Marinospirillum perlucidum]